MAGQMAGKVVVVTGSTSGIGEGIACDLAADGAQVVVSGRREELGQAVVATIRAAGGVADFCPLDVTVPEQCARVIDFAVERFGDLSGLVNNAGLSTRGTVVDMSLTEWHRVIDTNATAAFLLSKAAIPIMQRRGGGSIVLIGSVHTELPKRNMAAYCASRGATLLLMRQMAVEYLDDRIRVNLVNPGWVDTPGERELMVSLGHTADLMDQAAAANPLGRLLTPRDIARPVTYLLSDDSELVTGSVFDIHHEHPRVGG